jgi:hypothetical protein
MLNFCITEGYLQYYYSKTFKTKYQTSILFKATKSKDGEIPIVRVGELVSWREQF